MQSGIMLKQRDIILIPIPFTDLTSQKKRPAIVISNDNYNETHEDIVVAALTSNVEPRDFTITLTSDNLEAGTLKVRHNYKLVGLFWRIASTILCLRSGLNP